MFVPGKITSPIFRDHYDTNILDEREKGRKRMGGGGDGWLRLKGARKIMKVTALKAACIALHLFPLLSGGGLFTH